MIGDVKLGRLQRAVMSAVIFEGLRVEVDGKPCTLAVIDDDGQVVEAGPEVAREAWNVAIMSYRQFLIGQGHLRVHTEPPGALGGGQANG
jgi:hypothetical protein